MRTSRRVLLGFASIVALSGVACSKDEPAAPETGDVAESRHPHLQWKRYSALEADLMQALDLPADELCTEFGLESCIGTVHLAPLGGNEPFKSGLLEPTAEPLATTPAVMDRLLLSACGHRTELDRASKRSAKVFKGLDLEGDAPAPSDGKVQAVVTELYHRFLARDPSAQESAAVAELVRDDHAHAVPAAQFATLACFAVGTTTEFLFF
jgi:hypothetical protein